MAIRLGASSLGGKNANTEVNEAFSELTFPAKFKFTNLVAHALCFPEVSGLYLKPVPDQDNSVVVEVKDMASLTRLASSIDQVAFLQGHAEMVEVSEFVELLPEVVELDEEVDGELETDPEEDSKTLKSGKKAR